MSRYLLDVSVLMALVDPARVQHDAVHEWFGRAGNEAFATFPITENGLLRIVGHPRYPDSPVRRVGSPRCSAPFAHFPVTPSGRTASVLRSESESNWRCCPAWIIHQVTG